MYHERRARMEKEETVTDAWRRLAIGLAMLAPALQPAGVGAQGIALSLEDLSQAGRLQAGDGVIVTDVNGRRVKADVVGLSSDVLTVTDGRSEREFAEAGILKIDRQDSLMNGALLGLVGGALAASRVDLSSDYASATASGIVLFFGGGLLAGVLCRFLHPRDGVRGTGMAVGVQAAADEGWNGRADVRGVVIHHAPGHDGVAVGAFGTSLNCNGPSWFSRE